MAFTLDCDWDERMTYEEDKIVELMNEAWINKFDENLKMIEILLLFIL